MEKIERNETIIKDACSINQNKNPIDEIFVRKILERVDFIDILILKKFYLTGNSFPNDIQPYCFPFLYNELKTQNQINLTLEGLRKRLNNLSKFGLLKKVEKTNPSVYFPVEDMKDVVRKIIFKFFERYGFENLIRDLMK